MKFRLAFATLAMVTLASPAVARACSCSNGGARNALRRSTAVCLGKILSTAAKRTEPFGDVRLARIRVSQGIKGARPGDTQFVEYLVGTGGNCGLALVRGMKVLVYAAPAPGAPSLFTDYCAGTKLEECAARELRELGATVPHGARDCSTAPPIKRTAPPNQRPQPSSSNGR